MNFFSNILTDFLMEPVFGNRVNQIIKTKKNYNPLFLAKANRINGNPCIQRWHYFAFETKW